ncbi:transcription factor Opi1, partial [Entophlyctis helioformis]
SPSLGPYSPATSSSSYPESPYPNSLAHRGSIDERLPSTAPHVERKPRSRWHQVVAGVGANLGMITDDTMRALRYCLQFLQYAIANIDRQAGLLKQYLANAGSSVHGLVTGGQTSGSTAVIAAPFGAGLVAMLVAIRREIVETLRKVVDLVGRNASVYLTGDARQSVRGFILNLPSRLAGLAQRTPLANAGTLIEAASNAASGAGEQSEYAEAERVLTLASESSAMLKGIENVFSRTVDVSERVL